MIVHIADLHETIADALSTINPGSYVGITYHGDNTRGTLTIELTRLDGAREAEAMADAVADATGHPL